MQYRKLPQRTNLVVRLGAVSGAKIPAPVEPDGGEAGPLRTRNVCVQVVADMPHILRFNAKRAEGELKDPRIGLRNADLTRDHDCAETILDISRRRRFSRCVSDAPFVTSARE